MTCALTFSAEQFIYVPLISSQCDIEMTRTIEIKIEKCLGKPEANKTGLTLISAELLILGSVLFGRRGFYWNMSGIGKCDIKINLKNVI